MSKYEDITIYLSSKGRASERDRKNFLKWEQGRISTTECLEDFRDSNNIRNSIAINRGHFESWLNSLGYIRGGR